MTILEDDIKSAIGNVKQSGSGFYNLHCPVCKSKAKKGGFKFETDKIIYNCFRGSCDAQCEYVYGEYMYPKFRHLMDELGVDVPLELKLGNKKLKNKSTLNPSLYTPHHYKSVELMDDFIDYDPEKHWWFRDLLKDRHADFKRDLYVGQEDDWKHKLIIPCYHSGKMIGWQGVNYFKGKTFYLTSSENSDIMFINNPDGVIVKNPVIVEGIMDAVVIPNAIAVFGNHISTRQAFMLRHCDPILLPDRKGSKFLRDANKYKWRLSIPAWKHKDANSAVQTFGSFVVAKMIHDGIAKNLTTAETKYKMWKR